MGWFVTIKQIIARQFTGIDISHAAYRYLISFFMLLARPTTCTTKFLYIAKLSRDKGNDFY